MRVTHSINSAEDLDERAEELLELLNKGKTIPSAVEALFEVLEKFIEDAHRLFASKFYFEVIKVIVSSSVKLVTRTPVARQLPKDRKLET